MDSSWAWRNSCAFKPWTSRYESWTSANLFLVLIIDWSSILFMLNDNITWDIDQINNVFLFQVSDNTSTSFQPVASWQGLSFTYRRHKPKSTPNPWVGSFLQHRHSINFPQKGWDQPRRGCPEDTCRKKLSWMPNPPESMESLGFVITCSLGNPLKSRRDRLGSFDNFAILQFCNFEKLF